MEQYSLLSLQYDV